MVYYAPDMKVYLEPQGNDLQRTSVKLTQPLGGTSSNARCPSQRGSEGERLTKVIYSSYNAVETTGGKTI